MGHFTVAEDIDTLCPQDNIAAETSVQLLCIDIFAVPEEILEQPAVFVMDRLVDRYVNMAAEAVERSGCARAAAGLLLGAALFVGGPAGAQNLLKNGDFEAPFPVANSTAGWAVVFPGGADGDFADWAIAGRTKAASRGWDSEIPSDQAR